jgi:hypothetical protein
MTTTARLTKRESTPSTERDTQVFNYLKSIGIEPVKDSAGRPSVKQTIAALGSTIATKGNPDAITQEVQTATIETMKSELERMRGEVESARQVAVDAARDKETFLLRSKLATVFSSDIVDDADATDMAIDKFLKHHEIIDAEGEIFIRRDGEMVLGKNGKQATLEEAAKKFLDSKTFLRRSTVQAGGQVHGTVAAGTRTASYADLNSGRVSLKDVADGKVVIQ